MKFCIYHTAYQCDMQTVYFLDTFGEHKRRFGSDYTHITEADNRFTNMKF